MPVGLNGLEECVEDKDYSRGNFKTGCIVVEAHNGRWCLFGCRLLASSVILHGCLHLTHRMPDFLGYRVLLGVQEVDFCFDR